MQDWLDLLDTEKFNIRILYLLRYTGRGCRYGIKDYPKIYVPYLIR